MRLRKRKKVLNKQRRRVNGLKLILEDNRGKATAYFVPYRRSIGTIKKTYGMQVRRRYNSPFWQIEDESININAPETLINATVTLKRGNVRVVGKVRRVSPYCKSPGGDPVPVPPPPRT